MKEEDKRHNTTKLQTQFNKFLTEKWKGINCKEEFSELKGKNCKIDTVSM